MYFFPKIGEYLYEHIAKAYRHVAEYVNKQYR